MKELQEILKRVKEIAPGENAILATVVDIQGSGYRLPGARMLIDRDGATIGTVSGGCLEADVMERAKHVLRTGDPALITYDTSKYENSVFGLGMGCRGVVRVLLETTRGNPLFDFLDRCFLQRTRGALGTLVSKTNGLEMQLGTRFYATAAGEFINPAGQAIGGLNGFYQEVVADTAATVSENRSRLKTYETPHGEAEFFYEILDPPTSLLIFGAGNDAIPLADMAGCLGWRTAVIDHRPAWACESRFPAINDLIASRPADLWEGLFLDEASVAVVMNHNYDADREILGRLLTSNVSYIGVLGPKRRTRGLLEELQGAGAVFGEKALEKLYAPIGLDIGAATPEAIALAILAEIQAVLGGRDGGSLRDRATGIYDR